MGKKLTKFGRKYQWGWIVFGVLIFFMIGVMGVTTITEQNIDTPAMNVSNLTITWSLDVRGVGNFSGDLYVDNDTLVNRWLHNQTQNLWSTITSDSGSTTANLLTDTLTLSGGSLISTSVSGDTLTIAGDSNICTTDTAQTISGIKTFTAIPIFNTNLNMTIGNNYTAGACKTGYNGSCLNTYCSGSLVMSIGCLT